LFGFEVTVFYEIYSHMRFSVGLFCLSIAIHLSVFAQKSSAHFEHLSVEDGLSQSTVTCILQDRQGFLWLGTTNGLNKYDGYSFQVFKLDLNDSNSLSSSHITAIFEDKSGQIWIGTTSGLNKFDPELDRFTRYPVPTNSISSQSVREMKGGPDGRLWLLIGSLGIYAFDTATESFSQPVDPSKINGNQAACLFADQDGIVWIGTWKYGLKSWSPTSKKLIDYQSLAGAPVAIHVIREDLAGNIWIGSDGLYKFDRKSDKFTRFQHNPKNASSLADNNVQSILEDRLGTLWIGTMNGLSRFDMTQQVFRNYYYDPLDLNSLSDANIRSVCEDRSGILWVGTAIGGVNKLNRSRDRFKKYKYIPSDVRSLADNAVWSFCEDREGDLWIGTDKGVSRFDRSSDTFTNFFHKPDDPRSLREGVVREIFEDREGMVWIGTSTGLDRMERSAGQVTFVHYENDISDSNSWNGAQASTIIEDHSGVLWIGTGIGLEELDRKTGKFTHYRAYANDPSSLSGSRVTSICEDHEGTLWVGTGNGLNKFDRQKKTFTRFQRQPANSKSLSLNYVMCIYEDLQNRLWIGTYGGGLDLMDRGNGTFTHYTELNGLADDVINAVMADNLGGLWISTNKGLTRMDSLGQCRSFDINDGLQSNEFNQNADYKTRAGELYFGGVNGFNRFYPDEIKGNPNIPPVVMTLFKKFDKQVTFDKSLQKLSTIELSYRDNFFSFEFAALDFTSARKNQYAYKLEGFDEEWIHSGTRRYASYTNLNPGDYIFRVKGSNNDHVWNEEGAAIRLKISPPFWATWWFKVIALTLIIAGWYVIYEYRVRQRTRRLLEIERIRILENERVRKNAADDFHDEFGHKLTKIALLTEVMKHELVQTNPKSIESLDKIIDTSKTLSMGMRDFLWTLNPEKDSLHEVAVRLKDFGDELFERTSFAFRAEGITDDLEHVKLTMDARRQLTLIFKEAMNNILKHSCGRNVWLTFGVSEGNFEVQLQDDGKGFSTESNGNGQGLSSMKHRAEKLDAKIEIVSRPQTGAAIKLSAPVPREPHVSFNKN